MSPLRRLTRLEYDNTVRDLLGTTLSPAQSFSQDETAGPFFANVSALPSASQIREYMDAAELLAAEAVGRLDKLFPCAATGGAACANEYIRAFALRAFRRPPTEAEIAALKQIHDAGADFKNGARLVIEAVLQSPHFLYLVEGSEGPGRPGARAPLGPYELASRLSYFLWRTMPDEALFEAAATGRLHTRADIEAQARRLMSDRRFEAVVTEFHLQLLGFHGTESVAPFADLVKDETAHRGWKTLAGAARDEVIALAQAAYRGGKSYGWLLSGGKGFVDGALAGLYGLEAPAGGRMTEVTLPADGRRAGLLTTAGFLAQHGHESQSAPVHRGVFVRRRLLCLHDVPDPPPEVDTADFKVPSNASMREQITLQTSPAQCVACHRQINPIGFLFEHYDGVGQYRLMDGGKPVDASGDVPGTDLAGAMTGAVELSRRLARSEQAQQCLASHWAAFALAHVDERADACGLEAIARPLAAEGHDLRDLVVAVTTSEMFRHRWVPAMEEVTP